MGRCMSKRLICTISVELEIDSLDSRGTLTILIEQSYTTARKGETSINRI